MHLSTFSIVARDQKTGELAVAGGTNWFCYGRWVPHIEAEYGALATQAETNMWYATNGIENLKRKFSAQETISDLLKRDPDTEGVYQLLVLDRDGNTYCHTGSANHYFAGSICEQNLGIAGNTLVSKETLVAVADSFKSSNDSSLGLKMIKALQAGQQAGGDIRGMKSAALKVSKSTNTSKYWNDIIFDLRVDENEEPLKELERLYHVAKAYKHINDAEAETNTDNALKSYEKALILDPNNTEIKFWMARIYERQGREVDCKNMREEIRNINPNWDEYWRRLDSDKK